MKWDGTKFIIGSTCYCDECSCDCNYNQSYSKECEVTNWAYIDLPEFGMERYFDDCIV